MKKTLLVAALVVMSATSAFAASKAYQVTGPVTALDDKTITVKKGSESWEVARDSSTTVPDTVKVGSKVTVYYTMTAAKVEDKSPAAKEDKKAEAKPATDAKSAAEAKPAAKGDKKAK